MEMYIICGLTFMEEYEMSCSISYFSHCDARLCGRFQRLLSLMHATVGGQLQANTLFSVSEATAAGLSESMLFKHPLPGNDFRCTSSHAIL